MNRTRIIVASVLLIALALLAAQPLVALAESGITVISNSHKNEFPNQITFKLEASSSAQINKITLFYRMGEDPVLTYAYPKFDPGTSVMTEYIWNTQRKYVPPGIELHYYWVIDDATGNNLKTEPSTLVVEDTRFQWQKQTSDQISVFWYRGDARFASTILEFANKALADLTRQAGIQVQEPVKLYIYADGKDLRGALEPKAQEWTGGRAFSEVNIIALAIEPNASGLDWAERAVPHELSHVVIHQVTDNPYGDIPHWLDEGLAMYAEGDLEPSFQRILDAAIKSDRLISVKSLSSGFPADPEQARLSYAESHSLVDFILKRYGSEKMALLLAIFKEGSTHEDALVAALGVDIDTLETEWRASLGLPPAVVVEATPPPASDTVAPGQPPSGQPQGDGGICGGIFAIIGLAAGALTLGLRFVRL